jgi:hypothetical protein
MWAIIAPGGECLGAAFALAQDASSVVYQVEKISPFDFDSAVSDEVMRAPFPSWLHQCPLRRFQA